MTYRIPYTDGDHRQSVSTKCNTCTVDAGVEKGQHIQTEQEFIVLHPMVEDAEIDPMELLKLAKRLVICTQCGTFRLIN